MVEVVYIDVLFAVNLIINYFILRAASGFLHRQDKRLRLLLGAGLGAIYSIFIFFPQVSFLYSALFKAVISVLIVAVSFKFVTLRNLLKLVIVFYVISFIFGGAVFAIYLFVTPPGLVMRNGVVYIDISPVVLILSAAGCYILITLVSRVRRRSGRTEPICEIGIEADGRNVQLRALMDTGNNLTDAITGAPVIVTEYGSVENIIPHELCATFKKGTITDPGLITRSAWAGRFRMIPYGSVGAAGGLLPAFKPDRLTMATKKGVTVAAGVLVAVSSRRLSSDGSYSALIGPMVFDDDDKAEK